MSIRLFIALSVSMIATSQQSQALSLLQPDGLRVARIDRPHANIPISLGDTNRDGIDDIGYSIQGSAHYYFGALNPLPVTQSASASISGIDIGYELIADGRFCSATATLGAVSRQGWQGAKASVRTGGNPNDYQLRLDCGANTASARSLGDLNGDGSTDLWMGEVTSRAGYILAGATPGTPGNLFCPHGSTTYCSGGYVYRSTPSVLDDEAWPVGDVNADGSDDIAFNSHDAVHIVYGLGTSLPTVDLDSLTPVTGFTILRPISVEGRVLAVTGGADFDADGTNDFAISYDGTAGGVPSAGSILVVYGDQLRSSAIFDPNTAPKETFALILGALASGDFGLAIAATSDYNADEFGDLIVVRRALIQQILLGASKRWTSSRSDLLSMNVIDVASPGIGGDVRLQGLFDFNGDQRDDVLWHLGLNSIWITFGIRPNQLFSDGFEQK